MIPNKPGQYLLKQNGKTQWELVNVFHWDYPNLPKKELCVSILGTYISVKNVKGKWADVPD